MSSFSVAFTEAKADAVFAPFDQGVLPGVAVGVAIDGAPVYRRGFGLANMQLPLMLSPNIRMRLGSTSKHMACFAFLLLCDEGLARPDDRLGQYVPDLAPVVANVSLRELMTHVSGLRDVFDLTWQFNGVDALIASAQLADFYKSADAVNAPPGQTFSYNNGGYLLLSLAIEEIAGAPLEQVLRARVFDPIGMYDTALRRSERGFVENCATLHALDAAGGFEQSVFFGTEFLGEGGILSTVDDMLRWLAAMDAPGRREIWRQLWTPHLLANGVSTGYGFGLFEGQYRGLRIQHHPGGGMGASAQMLKAPDLGLDIIVMTNRGDVSPMALVDALLDASVEGLDSAEHAPARQLHDGLFHSPQSGRVIALVARDGRQFAALNGMEMPVASDGAGALAPIGNFAYAKQHIVIGAGRAPSALTFFDYGNADTLERICGPMIPAPEALIGAYRASDYGVDAEIVRVDGAMRFKVRGRFDALDYPLRHLGGPIWQAGPMHKAIGGVLVFDAALKGFRFSCNRTWDLGFTRLGSAP